MHYQIDPPIELDINENNELIRNQCEREQEHETKERKILPGALPNKPPPAGLAPNAGAAAAPPKSEGAGAE